MNTKTCIGCGETKPATTEFFHTEKTGKGGLRGRCKVCRSLDRKKPVVYEFPASRVCSYCGVEKPATLGFFHKDKKAKHGLTKKCKVCQAEYRAKPEVKQRRNERHKERYDNDTQYKLSMNLRGRLSKAIKRNTKSASTLELLGCTVEHLKNHLESQFTDGMNWDNYGYYGWHIDHIIPIDSFDLTDPAQQRECFHFSNLQPLWAKENISKGAKLETVF